MPRFFNEQGLKKGSAPGSLIFTGTQKMEKPLIEFISYSDNELVETKFEVVAVACFLNDVGNM
jgi:hypothetical protein